MLSDQSGRATALLRQKGSTVGTASGSSSVKPSTGSSAEAFSKQREFLEEIRKAGRDDFGALWQRIMDISDQYQRRAPREVLYQRWVAVDPEGAYAFIREKDRGQLDNLMTVWARTNIDGALTWSRGLGDATQTRDTTRQLMAALARSDPEKFLSTAAQVPEDHIASEATQMAFRKLARRDLEAARAALDSANPKMRTNGSWALALEWGRQDPQSAFAWVQTIEPAVDKQSALRGLFRTWALNDPQAVMQHLDLLQEVSGVKGENPRMYIARGLAAQNPRTAFDWIITNIPRNERMSLLTSEVLPQLPDLKPVEIVKLMDQADVFRGNQPLTSTTYLGSGEIYIGGYYPDAEALVSAKDSAAAVQELSALPDSPSKQMVMLQLCRRWADQDLPAVLARIDTAAPEMKALLASATVTQLTRNKDIDALAKIVPLLPNDGSSITHYFARELAQQSPQLALQFAEKLPEGNARTNVRSQAINSWATYDTQGALAWANQQPEDTQPNFYRTISSAWASSDSYANSVWVSNLPQGALRDSAITGMVGTLADSEPQSALAWAQTVAGESERRNAMQNLFYQWMRRDREAATQALDSVEMPVQQKDMIKRQTEAMRRY